MIEEIPKTGKVTHKATVCILVKRFDILTMLIPKSYF